MENDDENENLEELEQQLYAQVFHDSNLEEQPQSSIDDQSVTSNQSKNMRYWQNPKDNTKVNFKHKQKFKKGANSTFNKPQNANETQINENVELAVPIKPYFVPYTSVLSFMNNPTTVIEDESLKDKIIEPEQPKNYEKKKTKIQKYPKEKAKFLKPAKKLMKVKYEEKKIKAEEVRKKLKQNGKNKTVIIDLATSSDDDSVIHIDNPAPPLILLDSSDDEQRKSKKRAASPSTSSMISDDFIVAGDKRRLVNPFANPDQLNTVISDKLRDAINEKNEKMRKMKALTKVSSSSSNSNSARSSCERNLSDEKNSSTKSKKSRREKVCNSNDLEDSIYSSKAMTSKKDKSQSSSSSNDEDNSICVTAKDSKARRRKSTGSRKGKDSENEEDPKQQKLTSSTPLAHKKKRSRFITPNYNEDEFASLISTAIQADDEETNDSINNSKVVANDSIEKVDEMPNSQKQIDSQVDCMIIEQDIPVIDVPSDTEQIAMELGYDSDSNSIKNFSNDIECDLTLNIKQNEHTPHEFAPIEDSVTSEREIKSNYLDCEIGWNDEMRYFYNECTYGRDFCIVSIKNAMPADPKVWRVNHADRIRFNADGDRRIRCRNCNEWGHKERYCSRPRKKIICYMCGEIGHRETRCPNSICLRCGKPNEVFATMCGNCSKVTKKTCPLCHLKGHDIDQCPDKWRRYHSTTTVTDNAVLDISYTQNERMYCSLCARSGHFAENCSYINKMLYGLIKSSWFVISNKPSYPTNYSFNASRENEHVLQLFTYMENYSFNLKLPSNCQFYPKFKEAFLRHTEQLRIRELPTTKSSKQKKRKVKKNENKSKVEDISKTKEPKQGNSSNVHHHDDSNSNYSFSEFYKPNSESNNENQIISDRNNPQELSDYVPLVSTNRNIENINENQLVAVNDSQQKICDAKVLLTKEHASILMSPKGQNALFDLGERFQVVSQFKFDSMGNSIWLTGTQFNQLMFHNEMKQLIYKIEIDEYERMIEKTTQIPKIICRIVSFLKSNFQSIKSAGLRETKQLLDKFTDAERTHNHRKAVKCRKALNILFIGHAELGDGAKHMSELKKILAELERDCELGNGDQQVDPKLRNEISAHIRYIFSAVDHSNLYGDYRKMFEEYRKVIAKRQNNKNLLSSNRCI